MTNIKPENLEEWITNNCKEGNNLQVVLRNKVTGEIVDIETGVNPLWIAGDILQKHGVEPKGILTKLVSFRW